MVMEITTLLSMKDDGKKDNELINDEAYITKLFERVWNNLDDVLLLLKNYK